MFVRLTPYETYYRKSHDGQRYLGGSERHTPQMVVIFSDHVRGSTPTSAMTCLEQEK